MSFLCIDCMKKFPSKWRLNRHSSKKFKCKKIMKKSQKNTKNLKNDIFLQKTKTTKIMKKSQKIQKI